jgi:hypothetical protein
VIRTSTSRPIDAAVRTLFVASWVVTALSSASGCAATTTDSEVPVAKLGKPSDDVDPEIIGAAVRGNSDHFQMCYEQGREVNPELAGRVAVRFVINRDGTISQAQAVDTSLPTQVTSCVVAAFNTLQLPHQEAAVIAEYPMFFQPS